MRRLEADLLLLSASLLCGFGLAPGSRHDGVDMEEWCRQDVRKPWTGCWIGGILAHCLRHVNPRNLRIRVTSRERGYRATAIVSPGGLLDLGRHRRANAAGVQRGVAGTPGPASPQTLPTRFVPSPLE